MVTEFGMSDKLGPLSFGKRDELVFLGREIGEQRNYSDEVAKQIDEEVRAIIDKAYERATEVLTTHRDRLVALAEKLVAEETVDADTFETLFQDLPPKTPRTACRPSWVPGSRSPSRSRSRRNGTLFQYRSERVGQPTRSFDSRAPVSAAQPHPCRRAAMRDAGIDASWRAALTPDSTVSARRR